MTYGNLTSLIHFVAMELYTDLKLKEQLKKDKKFSSNELRNFCQDVGFPSIKPPSVKRLPKIKRSKKFSPQKKSSKRKGTSRGKRSKKASHKTSNECWTCGKSGHKSPNCPRNKKKRKKINLLQIDEETKEKFLTILNEEETESELSSEEEEKETEDEEFLNVAQDNSNNT